MEIILLTNQINLILVYKFQVIFKMGDPDDDNSIEQVINTVESFENTKEEDLLSVIQGFNDAQSSRYEQYRRSHFDRTCIKRVCSLSIALFLYSQLAILDNDSNSTQYVSGYQSNATY